jgi:hypothetical protein
MATLSNEAVVHVSLFPDETDNPTNAFVLIETVIVLPNWVQTTSSADVRHLHRGSYEPTLPNFRGSG